MTAVETSVLRESHIERDRRTESMARSLKHEKTRPVPVEDGTLSWVVDERRCVTWPSSLYFLRVVVRWQFHIEGVICNRDWPFHVCSHAVVRADHASVLDPALRLLFCALEHVSLDSRPLSSLVCTPTTASILISRSRRSIWQDFDRLAAHMRSRGSARSRVFVTRCSRVILSRVVLG